MNFLEYSINKLNLKDVYYTPEIIIKKINMEKIKTIIGNPPVKIKQKKKKYDILSPDGFSIEFNKYYTSINNAKKAFDNWLKRYETQGYYSSNFGRIPLNEVENHCKLIEL